MNILQTTNEYVITSGKDLATVSAGAKGRNLATLSENGLPVPAWFIVAPSAFHRSLAETVDWAELETANRVRKASLVSLHSSVLSEIKETVFSLGWQNDAVAVRSSSPDEDGNKLSYAGQFTSVLNVKETGLASAIEQVWRSAFTEQILSYRSLNGITAPPEPPSVIVQKMVDCKLAGVAFGADPITGDSDVVAISSVTGYADKLVSGEVDSATYILRNGVLEFSGNEKEGALTNEQLLSIKKLVDDAGEIFGCPQDIEWAIDVNDKLFILQSRPITTLKVEVRNASEVEIEIFDNSNIGESYPGITTPLTFSFARKAYQHVYEAFCRLMGVSEKAIAKNAFIFPNMLGLIRGRIYYNLINWYRLLSLFPGFKMNRKFMEQMMGLKKGLPQEALKEFDGETTFTEKLIDTMTVASVLPTLLFKWNRLPRDIEKFNRRVETALEAGKMPASPGAARSGFVSSSNNDQLSAMKVNELAALYRRLENDLLLHWDAPIVNDFFAMVSFGLLRGVSAKWLCEHPGIHNQLLCGETGIISTEPVVKMKELAALAARNVSLLAALESGDLKRIEETISECPEFSSSYKQYLDKFGDRCTGELKLESPTVTDNPGPFLAAIANMAKEVSKENNAYAAQREREIAEQKVMRTLKNQPIRLWVFKLILAQTRSRIRERENLRFMRTRVFGIVRRIFVEIGRQLQSKGVLENYQDIFYLETEEVLNFIETNFATNLIETIDERKAEFARYKNMPNPADRLIMRNGIELNDTESNQSTIEVSYSNGFAQYSGLGCCPGIVRGRARVIEDPNNQQLEQDEVLVAKRTDPGWITVIAQAKGIVVEYGSLLSHTAIVARELGIPTVVSVSNVTESIKSGDWVELDGAEGVVRVARANVFIDTSKTEGREAMVHTKTEMKSEIQKKADFSFVRYAQCWEDTDIVLRAMNVQPGDHCLSIASAGDNTLSLLTANPGKVVALDLNPTQLALLELKVAAFKCLDYDNMLVLLGYKRGDHRLNLFDIVKDELSDDARNYWEHHWEIIENGVASCGKFERYFQTFRKFVLPLIHSKTTVNELIKPKSLIQRQRFYDQEWSTWKWRTLFKVFFSEIVMAKLGRHSSFFMYAETGLADNLLKLTRRALVEQDPSRNPYLHWILKGEFGSELPHFLRKENFNAIKSNLNKLEWHLLSLEEYLSQNSEERFHSFNLSDVFEYVSHESYVSLMELIESAAQPEARIVYFNMMAERNIGTTDIEGIVSNDALSAELYSQNKTFFYSDFLVEEVAPKTVPVETTSERAA